MNNEATRTIVKVEGLVKNYVSGEETLHILKGINFSARQGSSIAVSGQSGSGKSTFLNILGGLENSDEGAVWVNGINISRLGESGLSLYRQKRIGFVFQFHYLLKDFTALENVMLPAYMSGMKKKAAIEKAKGLLSEVRLYERLTHYPSELSGGERQRVAVARSMVNNPDIILADEPTGNLDAQNSAMVAELLFSLPEKWGKTLVVVTHDETVAKRAAVRYNLENGLLVPKEKESR
jgi:lipoprotein-releasing system ATP-binding protein